MRQRLKDLYFRMLSLSLAISILRWTASPFDTEDDHEPGVHQTHRSAASTHWTPFAVSCRSGVRTESGRSPFNVFSDVLCIGRVQRCSIMSAIKRHPNKNGGRPISAGRINRAKSRISDDENTSSDGIFTESTRVVIAQPLVTRPVRGSTMILSLFSNSPTHCQRRVSEYAVVVRKGSGGAECGCARKCQSRAAWLFKSLRRPRGTCRNSTLREDKFRRSESECNGRL